MEGLMEILIILLIVGAVAIAIVLPKRLQVKHPVVWRIGFAVLCILLVIAGVFIENQIWEAKRYDSIEEMVENCIPDAQLKDVIYYEDYAVLFLDENPTLYRTTKKDEKGWKAYRRDRGWRKIQKFFGNVDISTHKLNDEGLDFIWIDPVIWHTERDNPDNFQHEVGDNTGQEFTRTVVKGLNMPIYYTFADADAPGYEVSVDGNYISISKTCKQYGDIVYRYSAIVKGEYSGFPIVGFWIAGTILLSGAILTGVFAYRRKEKKKTGLVVWCVIFSVLAFLALVQAFFNTIY